MKITMAANMMNPFANFESKSTLLKPLLVIKRLEETRKVCYIFFDDGIAFPLDKVLKQHDEQGKKSHR